MARSLAFLCGEKFLEGQYLQAFIGIRKATRHESRPLAVQWIGETAAYRILEAGDWHGEGSVKPFSSLFTAMCKYSQQECGDVRDRFFGLVDFQESSPIRADYSLSLDDLCHLVTTHLIEASSLSKESIPGYEQECRKILGFDKVDNSQLLRLGEPNTESSDALGKYRNKFAKGSRSK
jgi:hypothetical protein